MPLMTERTVELTNKALRQVARHKSAVDMTIYPNGSNPNPEMLLGEIQRLKQETPTNVRIIRRRVKRRSAF